ncbi:uncharacterized protein LOC144750070 [Ciona intestinalis]
MPQLNSDEAANDEPKTYNDERVGEEDERGWHENDELDNIKGDLVEEEDRDPHRRQSYDVPAKVNSRHRDSSHRSTDDIDRDLSSEIASSRSNFPYLQQDIGAAIALNQQSLLSSLPSSSQVPYNPYAYHHFLYGTPSPTDIDGKPGIPRHNDAPAMYPLPGQLGQIPHPLSPWGPTSPTPFICTASAMAGMLRYPYPFASQFTSTSGGMSAITPFPLVPPHVSGMHPTMIPHPAMALPGHLPNGHNQSKGGVDKKNYGPEPGSKKREKGDKPSRPYVKKPLNAFMLYMKEQRAKVVAECTLKESAAINQILGRKWHSLNREEQQKYYEMARKERQLHQQMFPGWSARDNYGKRKKRKKEKTQDCTAQNPKKCRAVFGLEQQQLWCAPCRRKKKCIRYQHDDDDDDSDDDSDSIHYQPSPTDNGGGPPSNFDDPSMTSLSTSSVISSNNGGQSTSSVVGDRFSPNRGHVEIPCDLIKQEKSPPLSHDNVNKQAHKSARDMFQSSSNYEPSPTDSNHSADRHNCAKRPRTTEPSVASTKSFTDVQSRHLQSGNTAGKTQTELRNRRSNSFGNSPMPHSHPNNSNNLFSPTVLSPGRSPIGGLNSPHSNNFFPHFQPYLQMSTLAALPPSPLGGFMGLPGFKGLQSPMGLSGAATTANPGGGHPGTNSTRRATSALEGKS